MNRSLLLSVFATAVLGAMAGSVIFSRFTSPGVTAHAQVEDDFGAARAANGRNKGGGTADPSAVGTWFGVARPCPATGDDAGHAAFCQQICGTCGSIPGTLPPEVPMMPTVHSDNTVTVNDAGSIAVFHTTAQGAWAADPDKTQPQIAGRTRFQASFLWLQGDGKVPGNFVGVARPRFVTYFDPTNPDNMIGYIQPHFFPIVGPNGLVQVLRNGFKGSLDVTNHFPAINSLDPLPAGCQNPLGCLGTYHFTIHRVKANVPN